jgi:ATP-binding cassette subfamily F protein 3
MRAKDVLLTALQAYNGTAVFVSHDRYFLDKLATRVVEVENGRVNIYPGNYEDYVWRKSGAGRTDDRLSSSVSAEETTRSKASTAPPAPKTSAGTGGGRLNPIKLRQMKDRRRAIEDEVTRLEVEIADFELALSNFVSAEETKMYSDLLTARKADLEALLLGWEEVANAIEASK